MKKLLTLGVITSCLLGCQEATVLSNDGKNVISFCNALIWITCVAKACPNGYDPVKTAGAESIIKCK